MIKKRIIFMGTPQFAVPSLKVIVEEGYNLVAVVTQPDRPSGRKQSLTFSPVKEEALLHGVPIFQPDKLRATAALAQILSLKPDLIVTAAYGQILPEQLLSMPTYGCINVHASLLPKYRGGAPIHWAIIKGEKQTGITIMYMEKTLDTGDIILQKSLPIAPDDHVGTLHAKLSNLGAELLRKTLPLLFSGGVKATAQNDSAATYAPNIKREDEIINWNLSASQIAYFVRGLHPWPVASTSLGEEQFKIWWAEQVVYGNPSHSDLPGTVLELDKEGIYVATGEGVLLIKEVQPAGKRRMPASQFILGNKIKLGDQFGK